MLGLGLGFVRGMFGKASTQFDEIIGAEPEPPKATSKEPITLSKEVVITQPGKVNVLKIQVFNPKTLPMGKAGATTTVYPIIKCIQTGAAAADKVKKINGDFSTDDNPTTPLGVSGKIIASQNSQTFSYVFSTSEPTSGTYICQVLLCLKDGADAIPVEYVSDYKNDLTRSCANAAPNPFSYTKDFQLKIT